MARAVYSTRFLRASGGGTQSSSYEVPAGFVAVLRDVTMWIEGEPGAVGEVFVESPTTWVAYWTTTAAGVTVYQWTGRQVIEEGEVLAADANGSSGSSILGSGYLLAV